MKTKSDLLSKIDSIVNDSIGRVNTLKSDLFELYKTDSVLVEFLNRVDNHTEPTNYEFDLTGSLVSTFELTFNKNDYPYLKEYFDSNIDNFFNSELNRIEVSHGYPITVDALHTRRQSYVFDTDTNRAVIDSSEGMKNLHVQALIQKHQRNLGQFYDVVEIDSHGQYVKHFETEKSIRDLTDSELDQYLDSFTSEEV